MNAIERLIKADQDRPTQILVLGDPMIDEWVEGSLSPGQEGCPRFKQEGPLLRTPGGAANAAAQLCHWRSEALLCAPWAYTESEWDRDVNTDDCPPAPGQAPVLPVKRRLLDRDGRVLFRHDAEQDCYGLSADQMARVRLEAQKIMEETAVGAVLLSDYDKGFLSEQLIRETILTKGRHSTPVLADAKRRPGLYRGSRLQCNDDYNAKFRPILEADGLEAYVVTRGPHPPLVMDGRAGVTTRRGRKWACPPPPVNRVGAGDCFAAHLALATALGLDWLDACDVAYAAGRVYVRHPPGRAPWPHEIRREFEPVAGKIITPQDLHALRKSLSGKKLVFTNGVFRLPHAGHAWLMEWARARGDVLVAGLNDDASAARQRTGEFVMPLAERAAVLAGQQAVDWVIPFAEDTPETIMEALRPDVLVKGAEYRGARVPGDGVCEVRFAPPGPFPQHATDLVAEVAKVKSSS